MLLALSACCTVLCLAGPSTFCVPRRLRACSFCTASLANGAHLACTRRLQLLCAGQEIPRMGLANLPGAARQLPDSQRVLWGAKCQRETCELCCRPGKCDMTICRMVERASSRIGTIRCNRSSWRKRSSTSICSSGDCLGLFFCCAHPTAIAARKAFCP